MIERLVVAAAVVGIAALLARWWQGRQGRLVATTAAGPPVASALLFTSPGCRHCPQVRQALAAVGAARPSFTWHEVDAATDLDTARRHRVLRAPTVLFLDGGGAVVGRASGAMGPGQVASAVGLDPAAVADAR